MEGSAQLAVLQGAAPAAHWRWVPSALALTLLVLFLAFLSVYPLAMLLYGSVHTTPPGMPGSFDLSAYAQVFTGATALVLWNTVAVSFLHTALSLVVALGLAWIVARTDTPCRRQFEVLITLPFFIPPILTAMAWGMLGNAKVGGINQVWRWATGTRGTIIDMYSFSGVVWHMMQYAIPFLFLLVVDALRAIDPSYEEAARTAGAGRWRALHSVAFRSILPILTAAFLLSFMRGMENFESALFFGLPAGIHVITTTIYDSITQSATPQYQFATALSFVVMLLMALLVIVQGRVLHGRSFTTVTGKGFRPRIAHLGRWRWFTFALCCLVVLVMTVLPVGQLLVGSLFRFYGFYSLKMLTFQHYVTVFSDQELWRGIFNTMILGLAGATATMALAAIVAYIAARTRWRVRVLVDALAWLPWLMPGIVLAIGLLWAYALMPGPVQIYGTLWALLMAYMALGMPLSVRIMAGAYGQLSADLEESSRVHGAGFWRTLWSVLVALAWPSFAVGWVLAFFGILRELSASILLYSVGSEVLSVELLKLWVNGQAAEVSIVGLMTIALVVVFRIVQLRFLARGVAAV
jgi:iron(III) transport system permease protein